MPKHLDPKPQSKLDEAYEKLQASAKEEIRWIDIASTVLKVRTVLTFAVVCFALVFDHVALRVLIPVTTLMLMCATDAWVSFKRIGLWKVKSKTEENYFECLRETSKENAERTMDLLANVLLTESFDQSTIGSKEFDRTLN